MKNFTRKIAALLFVLLLAACFAAADNPVFSGVQQEAYAASVYQSGTCGKNLTWTHYRDGRLVISGTGPMTDWESNYYYDDYGDLENTRPWVASDAYPVKEVIIEQGVTTIGKRAFAPGPYFKYAIEKVTIPSSVKSINACAFESCYSLKEVNIANGVKSINSSAFSGCFSLESISIPDSVDYIGSGAFNYCEKLTNIKLPSSITVLNDSIFRNCRCLSNITIPNGVTAIKSGAFRACYLVNIYIPASVKEIGSEVFKYGSNSMNVYYGGTAEQWSKVDVSLSDNPPLATANIHYFSAPKITKQPQNAVAADGKGVYTTIEAEGHGLTYKWLVKEPNRSDYYESATVTNKYSYSMTPAKSGRQVYCVVTDIYGNSVTSEPAVLSMLAITKQPEDCTAAEGVTASAAVAAQGDNLTYKWYISSADKNSFIDSGVDTAEYSFKMTAAGHGTKAYCVITDKHGNSVKSNTVVFALAEPLRITAQPADFKTTLGKTASAKVSVNGDDPEYKWYVCEAGETAFKECGCEESELSFEMTAEANGRRAYCVITSKHGSSAKTDTVTFTLAEAVRITKQPENTKAHIGLAAKTTVTAEGDGLTYKWYVCEPSKTNYYVSSIKSSTYSYAMTEAKNGRKAYCIVTDAYGNSAVSSTVILTADYSVRISSQPTDKTVRLGETVSAYVGAVGTGLEYQWYVLNPNDTEFIKSSITKAYYSYTMTESKSGRQVYCVVTDSYGNSVKSDTVTLKAKAEIKITSQPANASAELNKIARTTVKATGLGLKYQWYVCDPGKSSFIKSSITSSTYSATMTAAKNGRRVYCVITDSAGNRIESNIATLTTIATLSITSQPKNASAAEGTNASTVIKASGIGLTYQWYVLDPGSSTYVKSSVTKSTYSCKMTAAKDGRKVYCVVTDEHGRSIQSNIAVLTID